METLEQVTAQRDKAISIISAASSADAASVAERLTTDVTPDALATELFEPKYKAQRDQGHKIGTDKTFRKVEQALKAAGADEVTLDAISEAIAAVQHKASATNSATLTEEQALKLPAVVRALNAQKLTTDSAVAEAVKSTRAELEGQIQAFAKTRTESAVRAAAEAEITRLNPNFTPGKETAQRERLVRELLNVGGYQVGESGEVQLIDGDGNLLPGKLGNGNAKFTDLVRERAEEVHGLPVSGDRQSPGITTAAIGQPAAYTGPTTEEELTTAILKLQNNPDAAEKLAQEFAARPKS